MSLIGQAAPGGEAARGSSDDVVAFMRGTLEPIRLYDGEGRPPLKIRPEPAFRLGKQAGDIVQEGAIFFWVDDAGRPQAAAQVFQVKTRRAPDGYWVHELVSLAPGPLTSEGGRGGPPWNPQTAGVTFRPVPGAPRAAATPAQRDRQLRALAREFQATDFFHQRSWTTLRLLPTPVARYGKSGSAVLDGALFAFVTGTDPEAFLFIEARGGKDGPEWQYAFAPMTSWELKGSHRGAQVWTAPLREGQSDPSRPYCVHPIPDRYDPPTPVTGGPATHGSPANR